MAASLGPAPGGGQSAGVAFEESDVRAEAGNGDVDGDETTAGDGRQREADQRRFAIAARRDQEHFLRRGQIAHQAVELDHPVGEGGRRHHLAVDERIAGYVEKRNGYAV